MNVTGSLIEGFINEMNRDEISITLALLQKRQCETQPSCRDCPWRGSILCLPLRRYLEMEKERMNEEKAEEK